MFSRVIGRGVCPKCGREGSLVFKELYGKIYVYFKHGRKWCYVGPLDKIDLSSLLISLETYHTFTTKFLGYLKSLVGEMSMKLATMFIISLTLTSAAYGLSTAGSKYNSIVLTLTIVSDLMFAFVIAFYESIYKEGKYKLLDKVVSKGKIVYLLFSISALWLTLLVTYPLASPITLKFYYRIPVGSSVTTASEETRVLISKICIIHEVMIPLTSIIASALILALLLRPHISKLRFFLTYLVLTPLLAYIIILMLPLLKLPKINYLSLITYSLIVIGVLGGLTITITLVYTVLIEIIKRLFENTLGNNSIPLRSSMPFYFMC